MYGVITKHFKIYFVVIFFWDVRGLIIGLLAAMSFVQLSIILIELNDMVTISNSSDIMPSNERVCERRV